GRGSRVRIILPLTLAILPVLMLRQAGQVYAVPLAAVREVIDIEAAQMREAGGRPAALLRGGVLPGPSLDDLLGPSARPPGPTGVVANVGGRMLVLRTDEVVGQDEVMIKPLESIKPRGVAGATQSGDGALVLVLELGELVEAQAQVGRMTNPPAFFPAPGR